MMRKIKIGAAFSLVAVTSVMFANEDTQGSATTRDAKNIDGGVPAVEYAV